MTSLRITNELLESENQYEAGESYSLLRTFSSFDDDKTYM